MAKMLFNEHIIDRDNIVNIEDRGYQFGDGIYEVIGVYDGKPFMLDDHLERLQRSARELQLSLTYSIAQLKKRLEELVTTNSLQEGIIYMQVSRGSASREHYFPTMNTLPITVAYTREEKRMTDIEDQGAIAILTEDIRWLRCDIKTLNLLPNVLAKQKAVEQNAIEAIFHRGETITEASASNVFIVKDKDLYTHPANNYILNGITRRKVIQLCEKINIKVNEETFTVNDLFKADEVFITATKLDIVPILKVDDYTIGTGSPGETTLKILHSFRSVIHELSNSKPGRD